MAMDIGRSSIVIKHIPISAEAKVDVGTPVVFTEYAPVVIILAPSAYVPPPVIARVQGVAAVTAL